MTGAVSTRPRLNVVVNAEAAGKLTTLRTAAHLIEAGLAEPARLTDLEDVAARYAIAITPEMAALIDATAPNDPIARQFIPDSRELIPHPDEHEDPIGDHAHMPVAGLVHRYPDRVLLKPTHVCPVYCRFCFRREMVGPGGEAMSTADLEAAFAYIRANPNIFEVVITGGDPLMMSPRRLGAIIQALSAIPHLAVIRLHSRVPVVDPSRIDAALIAALETDKAMFVALHVNHPRELTEAAAEACRGLIRAGIPMLGQTVLLNGVNADAETLEALFRRLVTLRIKPYYLHHPDLAPGTSHFRVGIAEGQALMRLLRGRLSGIAIPTYILDIPGGFGKVPLGPQDISLSSDGNDWYIRDYQGSVHSYRDAT